MEHTEGIVAVVFLSAFIYLTPEIQCFKYNPPFQRATIEFCQCWNIGKVFAINNTTLKVFVDIDATGNRCKNAGDTLWISYVEVRLWIEKMDNSNVVVTKSFVEPDTCTVQTEAAVLQNGTKCIYIYQNITLDRHINARVFMDSSQVLDCNVKELGIDWSMLPPPTELIMTTDDHKSVFPSSEPSILLQFIFPFICLTILLLCFIGIAIYKPRQKRCHDSRESGGIITTNETAETRILLQQKKVLFIADPNNSDGKVKFLLEIMNQFPELDVVYPENYQMDISRNINAWIQRQTDENSCYDVIVALTTNFVKCKLYEIKNEDINDFHPLTEVTLHLLNRLNEQYCYKNRNNFNKYLLVLEEIEPCLLKEFISQTEMLWNCAKFFLTDLGQAENISEKEQKHLTTLLQALLVDVQLNDTEQQSQEEYITRTMTHTVTQL